MKRVELVHVCAWALVAVVMACTPNQSVPDRQVAPLARRAPVPGAPARVTAFVDVAVISMDTERVLEHQTVLVESGRITALGPSSQVQVPANATRIDGRGKFLLPGLADMHAHLYDILDNVLGARPGHEGKAILVAERRLLLYALNGVTTIRNLDYLTRRDGELALRLRARAAAGEIVSPRIYTSGRWRSQESAGLLAPETTKLAEVATEVAAYKEAGYDFIKLHDERGPEADSLLAAARRVGIPVAGHVPDQLGFAQALAAGYASFEHMWVYPSYLGQGRPGPQRSSYSGGWLENWKGLSESRDPKTVDPAHLAILKEQFDLAKIPATAAATRDAGVWSCPTLSLAEALTGAISSDQWPELRYATTALQSIWKGDSRPLSAIDGTLAAQRHMVKGLQDARAGLLLGTDAPVGYMVPGFSVHRELEALVRAGLTPYQALATSTRNVAVFLKTLEESGTVAVGKRADLMLLGASPLRDIRHTMHPIGVMIGGRWFAREEIDRRLATLIGQVS